MSRSWSPTGIARRIDSHRTGMCKIILLTLEEETGGEEMMGSKLRHRKVRTKWHRGIHSRRRVGIVFCSSCFFLMKSQLSAKKRRVMERWSFGNSAAWIFRALVLIEASDKGTGQSGLPRGCTRYEGTWTGRFTSLSFFIHASPHLVGDITGLLDRLGYHQVCDFQFSST